MDLDAFEIGRDIVLRILRGHKVALSIDFNALRFLIFLMLLFWSYLIRRFGSFCQDADHVPSDEPHP